MAAERKIEKTIVLRVPRTRVWRAITDPAEFGAWFGVKFDGPFVRGAEVRGVMAPTKVDPEVAKMQKKFEGMPFRATIHCIEPERVFSFMWHPGEDPTVDRSNEPETVVTFRLDEIPTGVRLTITETGFDQLPAERRERTFASNNDGWAKQIHLIEKYLADTQKDGGRLTKSGRLKVVS